jgi:hypothetical protein
VNSVLTVIGYPPCYFEKSVKFQDSSKSYEFNLISPLLERSLSNLVKYGLGVRVNLRMSEALRI